MKEAQAYLDRALELGHQELSHIHEENVDEADKLSLEREEIVNRISDFSRNNPQPEDFQEKLRRLQHLQNRITASARELHTSLSQELKRIRAENQRFTGYKNASTITPLFSSNLHKKG